MMGEFDNWGDTGIEVIKADGFTYGEVGKGPWQLYVYDHSGYHSGGHWFTAGKVKYPDEELPFLVAKGKAEIAIAYGLEVRICDGMDNLVFHSENGEVTYGATFWNEAKPDPAVQKVADRLKGRK